MVSPHYNWHKDLNSIYCSLIIEPLIIALKRRKKDHKSIFGQMFMTAILREAVLATRRLVSLQTLILPETWMTRMLRINQFLVILAARAGPHTSVCLWPRARIYNVKNGWYNFLFCFCTIAEKKLILYIIERSLAAGSLTTSSKSWNFYHYIYTTRENGAKYGAFEVHVRTPGHIVRVCVYI